MAESRLTPLGALVRGALAGAAGTLAMDLVWYRRYRRGGGTSSFTDWEFATATSGYEDAGPPAKLGRRVAEDVFDGDLPDESAGQMTNLVHWLTGAGYGAAHGVVSGSSRRSGLAEGLLTGPGAFATSYAVLPRMGLYEPLWRYDLRTIYQDLSAHVVYGLATAAVFRVLRGKRR